MKYMYILVIIFLGISEIFYQELQANPDKKKQSKAQAKDTAFQDKKLEESKARSQHYIYPRAMHRSKNQKSGVVVSGFSMKGSALVPYGKDTKEARHDAMMHVYEHTFHEKHGHVLEIMQALVQSRTKKCLAQFLKAVAKIHKNSDDWGALKEAVSLYDEFACKHVEFFEKERLQKKEPEYNNKLQKSLKKIAHTQPALMYASHSLAHSRKLLEEYIQDSYLDQCMQNLEKSLKNDVIQGKFNSSESRVVQVLNRLVALCVLLEGAVVHYCAVQDALVTNMEKKSVPVGKAVHEIIKEIKLHLM